MKQLNLSLLDTYEIVETWSNNEMDYLICDNCGMIIRHIAKVKNSHGKVFLIGMDCAKTLTGIKGDFSFEYEHETRFNNAKQCYSKLKKLLSMSESKGIISKLYISIRESDVYIDHSTEPFNADLRWGKHYDILTYEKYIKPIIAGIVNKMTTIYKGV